MVRGMPMLVGGAFVLSVISVCAQGVPPKEATDLPAVDIQNLLKSFPKDKTSDQLLRLVDTSRYNVAVAAVSRAATPKGGGALSHDKITEVYDVLRGSGTQVTEGTIVGAKPTTGSTVIGPSISGSTIEGGRTSKLGPGDVQIIPPNVAHMWSSIDAGGVDYLTFRFDPDHVLTMK